MPWFVALALLVVPIVEIYVIIQIGQVIGGWPTVALLLVESALGAWIIKREGRRAWRALQSSFETGKMPGRELADAALVLVGGTLLLTPGFVTDIFGFFFVLPFTRPLARRGMSAFFNRRLAGQLGGAGLGGSGLGDSGPGDFIPGAGGPTRPPQSSGDVVQGEVIDPDTK
ncbi:FxsA family protein [Kribbella sp. NBC_01484]|uniref:FxsA family protein n=1 Tax=Kribbella sp. NBC_01484 TaxID=2903579 RepID=UPI002E32A124|nr:FxsA family protein [Kribbella sp. NBC_01484]